MAGVGLGSGHADQMLNGTYSADFAEGRHADLHGLITRVGGVDQSVGHDQQSQAAALDHSVWTSRFTDFTHSTKCKLASCSWSASETKALR